MQIERMLGAGRVTWEGGGKRTDSEPPTETSPEIVKRIDDLRLLLWESVFRQLSPSESLVLINRELCNLEALHRISAPYSFPPNIHLPMTDICNARCRFCPYSPKIVQGQTPGLELIKRLDWLKFIDSVCFGNGFGEPFATKGLLDMLYHWRDSAPFTKFWTTSNGSLINSAYTQAVAGYIHHLCISLNAATKTTYEKLMPPLNWESTLANLERIRDEKIRLGTSKPMIKLSYAINLENAHEAPLLPALAAELGAETISWYHTAIHTSPHINYLLPATHHLSYHPALYNRVYEETRERCLELGIIFEAPLPFDSGPTQSIEFARGQTGSNVSCDMPWKFLICTNDTHQVQSCCGFGSPYFPKFTWPTAMKFHREVWNTPPLRYVRRTMGRRGELPICTLCIHEDKNNPAAEMKRDKAVQISNEILRQSWL